MTAPEEKRGTAPSTEALRLQLGIWLVQAHARARAASSSAPPPPRVLEEARPRRRKKRKQT